MLIVIAAAIANGLCIGGSRAVNGKLGQHRGALAASFWNHLGGLLFLSLLLAASGAMPRLPAHAPWHAWCGGVIGALFVALNSFALPRLGTMKTALLVIAGQMLAGVLIDHLTAGGGKSAPIQLAGAALIALGLFASRRAAAQASQPPTAARQA
ncbi:DMT family transporter [Chromobacterium subtsugae]|uniref:DMT family transporter n=2 Tax=Chromobacterium subtsugae TaxID=251747 RepID=UPI000640BA65|nr:DMT family transporter [Chromobacterium subtsugae]